MHISCAGLCTIFLTVDFLDPPLLLSLSLHTHENVAHSFSQISNFGTMSEPDKKLNAGGDKVETENTAENQGTSRSLRRSRQVLRTALLPILVQTMECAGASSSLSNSEVLGKAEPVKGMVGVPVKAGGSGRGGVQPKIAQFFPVIETSETTPVHDRKSFFLAMKTCQGASAKSRDRPVRSSNNKVNIACSYII